MTESATQPKGVLDSEATPTDGKKAKTDWESIEREFRAGVLSIREIGRMFDVSDAGIRKKAKLNDWERDLSNKVAEKVRADLVRDQVRTLTQEERDANRQTEREIIDKAAATVVTVVREHRRDISSGRGIVSLLMTQLTDVAGKRSEFEEAIEIETDDDKTTQRRNMLMKAVSMPTHAAMMRDLSTAMKNLFALERQAFNINGTGEPPPPDDEEQVDKVGQRYERVRAAINKRMNRADITE